MLLKWDRIRYVQNFTPSNTYFFYEEIGELINNHLFYVDWWVNNQLFDVEIGEFINNPLFM